MRSALTDAPVVSFTTLLLRTTQHTTGLMVKVALLLPPRDLLSSQRQLRWTHTLVLPIVGLDIETISSGNSVVLWFGAGRTKPNFSSYYLTLAKSQAAVPADEYKIPHHRQYLPLWASLQDTPTVQGDHLLYYLILHSSH